MSENFAIIDENNIVVNIVVGESKEEVEDIVEMSAILVTEETLFPVIGLSFDGSTFEQLPVEIVEVETPE